MRTYSHALLTYAAIRLAKHESPKKTAPAAAGIGATLPDIPMALGAAWLWARGREFSHSDFDKEVCGRSLFRDPDAALHSALAVASAMFIEHAFRGKPSHGNRATQSFLFRAFAAGPVERGAPANFTSAFLLGWAGHILTDFLTHGKDARPVFWPVSEWKFESPVSYRERERHGRTFTIVEHAAVLAVACLLLIEARRTVRES